MKSMELSVVGVNYRVTTATVHKLSEYLKGGPVACNLEREPDNVHDSNAIKVVIGETPHKGFHIGYLSRGVAATFAPQMDKKKVTLQAWLTEIETESGTLAVRISKRSSKENTRKSVKKKKSGLNS